MNDEELLELYLERLRLLASEKLKEEKLTVIEALKASLEYLEGEMRGY